MKNDGSRCPIFLFDSSAISCSILYDLKQLFFFFLKPPELPFVAKGHREKKYTQDFTDETSKDLDRLPFC